MTFMAGDRVVLVIDHPDHNDDLVYGCTGTVICDYTSEEKDEWVNIRWDEEVEGGHTCSGMCEDGYGWNVPSDYIRLIEDREVSDEDIAAISELCCFIGVAEENK